jgi:hypothetical protein
VEALKIIFVLLKSTATYIYLTYDCIILFIDKFFLNNIALLIFHIGVSGYFSLASTGNLSKKNTELFFSWIANLLEEDRTRSLVFRLENEKISVKKALERQIFGRGGFDGNRIYLENWRRELIYVSTTGNLWIITYMVNGMLVVVSLYTSLFFPLLIFALKRYPTKFYLTPQTTPAAVLLVVLTISYVR